MVAVSQLTSAAVLVLMVDGRRHAVCMVGLVWESVPLPRSRDALHEVPHVRRCRKARGSCLRGQAAGGWEFALIIRTLAVDMLPAFQHGSDAGADLMFKGTVAVSIRAVSPGKSRTDRMGVETIRP